MADLELFDFDQPEPSDTGDPKTARPGGGAPRTEARRAAWLEEETETSFTCKEPGEEDDGEEEEVQLIETRPHSGRLNQSWSRELYEEDVPELYLLSDDDLSDGPGSVDYGFVSAVTCLLTGVSLVALSFTVPRDVRVDPDSVSAREMERLEQERAEVGAHLDRCVIAGLCLLTLGGVLLSTLLMISMWKGEMMRRRAFAYSRHAAKLYGSISLRGSSPTREFGSSPTREFGSHLPSSGEDLEELG